MKGKNVHIIDSFPLTHDVKCIRTEKPDDLEFRPGQATEVFLDRDGWRNAGRPFTFTSLPGDPYVEFIIKGYPDHNGVTEQIHKLAAGDRLVLNDVFGDIRYKGKGLFIAGGAGITPFISILRQLGKNNDATGNRLIFGNKTSRDIFLQDELGSLLGDHVIHVLSDEKEGPYMDGFITRELIVDQLESDDLIYVCGPPAMMDAISEHLRELEISEERILLDEW
jgi:ferredoxin-NADP reductase